MRQKASLDSSCVCREASAGALLVPVRVGKRAASSLPVSETHPGPCILTIAHATHTVRPSGSGCNPLPCVASTVAMCSRPMGGSCARLSKPLTPFPLQRQLAIQLPRRRRQAGPASGRQKHQRPALPLASGRGAWARRHRPFHSLHPRRRPDPRRPRCGPFNVVKPPAADLSRLIKSTPRACKKV